MLLDLGLPGIDGRETIRRLRAFLLETPIIVLSAWGEDETKVEALDLGADDYIEKPFAMPELLARIRVAIRHVQRDGGLVGRVEPARARRHRARPRRAARASYAAARCSSRARSSTCSRPSRAIRAACSRTARSCGEVWGDPDAADPSNLRVFISALRRLIEPDPGHPERIETVAGVGYRFLPGGE